METNVEQHGVVGRGEGAGVIFGSVVVNNIHVESRGRREAGGVLLNGNGK